MIISGCIHAAANGIISFFLWLSSIPLHMYTLALLMRVLKGLYDMKKIMYHCSKNYILIPLSQVRPTSAFRISQQ